LKPSPFKFFFNFFRDAKNIIDGCSFLCQIIYLVVAKNRQKEVKKRSKKNLRKPVGYGLRRLSSKIIDHTQEATASEVQ